MRLRKQHVAIVAFAAALTCGQMAWAQSSPAALAQPHDEFSTARVLEILSEKDDNFADIHRKVQEAKIQILTGREAGKQFILENGVLDGREDMRLSPGETVVLDTQVKLGGKITYAIRDKYRLPAMAWLTVFFVVLSLLFGGLTGITSILGLAVSVGILLWFVIPRIVAGDDPLTACLIGCLLIACTSLYLAHGFNKRTTVALFSTTVTLGIAAVMDVGFVHFSKLFGMGSEESIYLQSGLLQNVNLRGLLLGGILIGCLGVLDDVTTAQTAAIDEISKANPALSMAELRRAGASVGKEHIASLINTLALAYVGASLPLLLLFKTQGNEPLWVTLNSEFMAEEIIRTLVGSATLLVAVPVSTWLAAYFLQGGRGGRSSGHSHSHLHSR